MTATWSDWDQAEALAEGWALFDCWDSEHPPFELQRLDYPEEYAAPGAPRLDDDTDAWRHVHRLAFDGASTYSTPTLRATRGATTTKSLARLPDTPNVIGTHVSPPPNQPEGELMTRTNSEVLRDLQARQGWSNDTLLAVILEALDARIEPIEHATATAAYENGEATS